MLETKFGGEMTNSNNVLIDHRPNRLATWHEIQQAKEARMNISSFSLLSISSVIFSVQITHIGLFVWCVWVFKVNTAPNYRSQTAVAWSRAIEPLFPKNWSETLFFHSKALESLHTQKKLISIFLSPLSLKKCARIQFIHLFFLRVELD